MDSHLKHILGLIESVEVAINTWLESFDHSLCTGKVWVWRAPNEGSERFISPDYRPRFDEVSVTQFLDELTSLDFRERQLPNYQDRWIGAMRLPEVAFGPLLYEQRKAKLLLRNAIRDIQVKEGSDFYRTFLECLFRERPALSLQKAYRNFQVVHESIEDGTQSQMAFSFEWRQSNEKQTVLIREQAIEQLHHLIRLTENLLPYEKNLSDIEYYNLCLTGIKNRPKQSVVRLNTQSPMPVINLMGIKTNKPDLHRVWMTAHASTPILHRSEISVDDLCMPKPMGGAKHALGQVVLPLRSVITS